MSKYNVQTPFAVSTRHYPMRRYAIYVSLAGLICFVVLASLFVSHSPYESEEEEETKQQQRQHRIDLSDQKAGNSVRSEYKSQRARGNNYRLAKPLPGQVTSDEYLKPRDGYSSWWCGGPPGNKDVLGAKLESRHYCAIRNLCIVQGRPTLFVESKEEVPGMGQDEKSYGGLPHCVFRDVGRFVIKANDKGETLRKAREEGRFKGGLTAFISSSYGQTHITHFMESLGQLFYGLNIFGFYQDHGEEGAYMKEPLSSNLVGAPENLQSHHNFNRTVFALKYAELERVLVAGAGGLDRGSFNEQFYRMLYTNRREPGKNAFTESDYRPKIVDSIETHSEFCFDEAFLAGASYDPFHQVHTPSYYRHRDWFYGFDRMSEDDRLGIEERLPGEVKPSADALEAIAEAVKAASGRLQSRPVRNVVMAHRTSKRKVSNAAELDKWMTERLPALLPEYEWHIRSINFGSLSNVDRVHIAHWADMIIGIHGADLTNLINMRPGSVVIELNPVLFFEPRFQQMSKSLQLHYLAWTCTRPSCTPAWHQVQRNFQNEVEYNYSTSQYRFKPSAGMARRLKGGQLTQYKIHELVHKETNGWFKWPTDRYVGEQGKECFGCNLMTCCTSMKSSLYGVQRESNVHFSTLELEELFQLMKNAALLARSPFNAPTKSLTLEERLVLLESSSLGSAT